MIRRVIELADVPLRNLIPAKVTTRWIGDQDHSRWVFRAPRKDWGGSFFKIWNSTYVRRDNILHGMAADFYDDHTAPALDAIVVHKGVCRGYVMKPGVLNRRLNAGFFELVKAKTQETGYFHVHFSACHTMLCDSKLSLLDLEAVYPIAEYPRMAHYQCKFDDADYERHVAKLYREAFPGTLVPAASTEGRPREGGPSASRDALASRLLWRLRAIPKRGWRQARICLGRFRPRTELIEL